MILAANNRPLERPGGGRRSERVKTITLLNQKGGVGKTTVTFNLAGMLAAMGHRVLGLDADPQSSFTQGIWGPMVTRDLEPAETIASLFAGNRPFPSEVIRPTPVGFDLVPGSRSASLFNVPDAMASDRERQLCIRDFLAQVDGDYDYALIDCSPNLHLCSAAALAASDAVVVPLQPENYGSQGIFDVTESIGEVRAALNPGLALAGFLLTMVERIAIHQVFEAQLREEHGADVFAATFPKATGFKEAIAALKPVSHHKPKLAPAKAVRAVVDELLARMEARCAAPGSPASLREAS